MRRKRYRRIARNPAILPATRTDWRAGASEVAALGEALMYLPLLRFSTDATMLAIEAQSVISVRLTQFAMGLGTSAESSLMVPKKFSHWQKPSPQLQPEAP